MMRLAMLLTLLVSGAAASTPLRILPCDSWTNASATGGWTYQKSGAGLPEKFKLVHADQTCLDIADGVPVAAPCQAGKSTQLWVHPVNSQPANSQLMASNGMCLAVSGTSYSIGPGVLLAECDPHSPKGVHPPHPRNGGQWNITATGSVMSLVGGCCGDIFGTRPVCLAVDTEPTCASLSAAGAAPWCDASLDPAARARALISKMTLDEKASNMDSHNFGVPRLGVPPNIFSEALHGMCSGCGKQVQMDGFTSTGCPTSFPQVISMGASWNRSLWTAVGTAVSDEVRGLYSQGGTMKGGWESALFLWAPNINPFRDPRWGRGQEVVSEEPLVCAEYAAHYIPALQGIMDNKAKPDQLPFLKTVATAKHYFDYDLEGVPPATRQQIDVNVSAHDQVAYFSPPFESAVKRGKTQSVMCSYNAVNGVPACLSSEMINGVMRDGWGFDGFVVSDCDAISDDATRHYIVSKFSNGSLQVQAQQAIRGGTDLNCGALYGEQNALAVRNGLLYERELDISLERIYTKAFQLGVIDSASPGGGADHPNANPYVQLGPEVVDTPAHRALALEGAIQGHVLLKNEGKTLPLQAQSVKTLALIGPHANGSVIFLGGPNYHGDNELVSLNTPLLRAQAKLPHAQVTYAEGCDVQCTDTSGFSAAVKAAADADTIIMFLGLDDTIENEGHDRVSLELPGKQMDLALEAVKASKPSAKVVVVLVNGGPIAVAELKESGKVGAIVDAFMPGQAAAEATFQLLLGEASFSGLLPVTVYDADFITQRPITNLDLRAQGGVTYRYFQGEPLWPFGHGVSYGHFEFEPAAPDAILKTTVSTSSDNPLCFNVTVNAAKGGMVSDVVVLGFLQPQHQSAIDSITKKLPNPQLCDFTRLAAVAPGTERKVSLCVDGLGPGLQHVSEDGSKTVLPGEYVMTVGVKSKGSVGGSGAGAVIGKVLVSA